jgi:ABC-type Fe3+/spermidine/putrescine transport system ATPase subunit
VIHVCHSLEEAKLLGDRVGIMRQGAIVQADTLEALINYPLNADVAGILRLENIFSGNARTVHERGRIACRGAELSAPAAQGPVEFMIRPWQVELKPEHANDGHENSLPGTVAGIQIAGPLARLNIASALPLVAYLSRAELRETGLREGCRVRAVFPAEAVYVFGRDAGPNTPIQVPPAPVQAGTKSGDAASP